MEIHQFKDYKSIIRERVRELKADRPFTLNKLANSIPVQYTYFSKVLNEDHIHFNDDQIFKIAQLLDLSVYETDYFVLLKSHQATQDNERRVFLAHRLEQMRRDRLLEAEQREAVSKKLNDEMAYLLDPLCLIVHLALYVKRFYENPKLLCGYLQISGPRMKKILSTLEKNGFIVLQSQDTMAIKELIKGHIHYGKDHPLMRTHQNVLKSVIPARLGQTDEGAKHSFLATFTLSQPEFELIKSEFQDFIKKVEKIVQNSPQEGVYQLSFDLLRWL